MNEKLINYKSFDGFSSVRAFTTSRHTIEGQLRPRFTGKPERKAKDNREQLAKVIGIGVDQLVFPRQTHTNCVADLTDIPNEELFDTDGLVTDKPGICLCIQTADCVPVLLFDPIKNSIAAVHAGWRGTVGLIVKEVVEIMRRKYLSVPKNIRAVIGPSIGPQHYEIGDEVVDAVFKNIPYAGTILKRQETGKFHFDLWEANKQILLNCGILLNNIEIAGRCTFTEEEIFYSARREGIETGRMVSGIMLKD